MEINKVAVWERKDGGVSITHFDTRDMREGETEDQFIVRRTEKLKLDPTYGESKLSLILKTDIPSDRTSRDFWSLKANKVQVDQAKVQAKEARKSAKAAVLAKLNISEAELDKLLR